MGLTILAPLVVVFELLLRRSRVLRPHRTQMRVLLGIFFLTALGAYAGSRLGWLPQDVRFGDTGVLRFAGDSRQYQGQALEISRTLAAGDFSPLVNRDYFAYARLVGILYAIFGTSPLAAMLFNAVFYMTSVLCVFAIARALFDDRTAVAATWIGALWPSFLLHETQTLRWVATTAGVHMALAGTVLLFTRSRVLPAIALAGVGYLLVLYDLPYVAQLLYVSLLLVSVLLLVASVRKQRHLIPAIACAAMTAIFVSMYHQAWPPTAGSESYTWDEPPKLPDPVPEGAPTWVTRIAEPIHSAIEGRVNRILDQRDRAIADAQASAKSTGLYAAAEGTATAIENARPLHNVNELVANLPSAYLVAVMAPFPGQLLSSAPGMTNLRRYALGEMLVYYALLPLTVIGFVVSIVRPAHDSRAASLFLVGFVVAVYGLLGTVIMNAGTLHRLRLPYMLVLGGFAVVGARTIGEWRAGSGRRERAKADEREIVLLSIPNTLSTRNLLRSEVLPLLKQQAARVVIVTPFADDGDFKAEFVRDNVVAYPMTPYRPALVERALMSFIYNVYLAGPSPDSLQLFLGRWTERHPWLGPWRRIVNSVVLSPLNRVMPELERLFTSVGDVGSYEAMLEAERPTRVAFSRLFFCDEIPLMRAAVRARIPSIGLVASWDNLTSKGPLVPRLDRLVVWNDRLRAEAIRFHRYSASEVAVTGAPHHDLLYRERARLASRQQFFASMGLDPSKRLIVYSGEDPAIVPDALAFVELLQRFVAEGRLSERCQILVRPHPQDDPARLDQVRRLPSVHFDLPGRPIAHQWMDMTQADLWHLYETLAAADVVVNVTSTIVVDAAMVDTPSLCIGFSYSLPPSHFQSPMRYFEMDHFRYAIEAEATTIVRSEEELLAALNRALAERAHQSAGRQQLVQRIAQFADGRSAERTVAAIMGSAARLGRPAIAEPHSTAAEAARVSSRSADVA